MIRILITDDHKLMREGLRKIIGEEQDMSIVGEARNADEALDYVRDHPVDVVLLDISMPGRSGLEVLPSLKQMLPAAHVVMLSMHNDERLANRALANGAAAYVNKDAAADELVDAIRRLFTPVT
ncbi:MAG: response regulator transcription factor [Chloroflexi bacterium]|nr:response regulator transcription factor [Chloroflexota bacterium]